MRDTLEASLPLFDALCAVQRDPTGSAFDMGALTKRSFKMNPLFTLRMLAWAWQTNRDQNGRKPVRFCLKALVDEDLIKPHMLTVLVKKALDSGSMDMLTAACSGCGISATRICVQLAQILRSDPSTPMDYNRRRWALTHLPKRCAAADRLMTFGEMTKEEYNGYLNEGYALLKTGFWDSFTREACPWDEPYHNMDEVYKEDTRTHVIFLYPSKEPLTWDGRIENRAKAGLFRGLCNMTDATIWPMYRNEDQDLIHAIDEGTKWNDIDRLLVIGSAAEIDSGDERLHELLDNMVEPCCERIHYMPMDADVSMGIDLDGWFRISGFSDGLCTSLMMCDSLPDIQSPVHRMFRTMGWTAFSLEQFPRQNEPEDTTDEPDEEQAQVAAALTEEGKQERASIGEALKNLILGK